jgi:hypothetical protein
LALVAAVVGAAIPALADPILFGGIYFEYVPAPGISWDDANAAAAAKSFMGTTGHLATVTSATQNAFLLSIAPSFSTFEGAWLGGQCINAAACSWVTGPLTGQQFSNGQVPVNGAYVNFGGLEPYPYSATSWVYMNIGANHSTVDPNNPISAGQWADAGTNFSTVNDPIEGYFVEFDITPPAVAIQIKPPAQSPVQINLKSGGTTPVAILSTPNFDATQVDPATISLAGAPVRLRGNGSYSCSAQDVNGDGLPDLVCQVVTSQLQLGPTSTQAVLTGITFSGAFIQGTEAIRVVGN